MKRQEEAVKVIPKSKVSSLQYRKLDFEEFAAAAISVHQMEMQDGWEQHARHAYELFEKNGIRPIVIEELASTAAE
ncbi:CDPK-related kinase 1 [Acorus calamus]|uniref:CDPK-related kinase 1 n=1 Tax=Acorus calamus TaxID=4465 RepID=A0AAV9EWU8_ACOCL|nr:CDPK-related kinase 1 [Acorus calamus]